MTVLTIALILVGVVAGVLLAQHPAVRQRLDRRGADGAPPSVFKAIGVKGTQHAQQAVHGAPVPLKLPHAPPAAAGPLNGRVVRDPQAICRVCGIALADCAGHS